MSDDIIFNKDQQAAYDAFAAFIINPADTAFVLGGYAGTGKTTMVLRLLDDLPKLLSTLKLIQGTDAPQWNCELTATTNKAAEVLGRKTGYPTSTIHSLLGLRVHKDYATGETTLRDSKPDIIENTIIFVDEVSFMDRSLLEALFRKTYNCKYILIGDPAQLTPINAKATPVFAAGFTGATLKEVVRQSEGNPILALCSDFRDTINHGEFFSFSPDGHHIQHMDRNGFEAAVVEEFNRSDWRHDDSKVLSWTNKSVIYYNQGIRECVQGAPELQVGDYAICNNYMAVPRGGIKTDQLVYISEIFSDTDHGVAGYTVTVDYDHQLFLPACAEEKKRLIKEARKTEDHVLLRHIDTHWIDLRAAYACTINKSQGSTYDRVFIDLDDVKKCRNPNMLARLLYVAVSRARNQVIFTGDLV